MRLLKRLLACTILSLPATVGADDLSAPRTVEELLATYGWYVDQKRIDEVMALFMPDAILLSVANKASFNGTEEIAELLSGAWQRDDDGSQRRHLITGIHAFDETPETLKFMASFGVVGTTPEGDARAYNSGYYQGVARKTADGLRFERLDIAVD